jgi:hypothetical protein
MKHAIFLLVLSAAACTDHLPLVGAPCPCAPGTSCDQDSGLCVVAAEVGTPGDRDAPGVETDAGLGPEVAAIDAPLAPDIFAPTPDGAPFFADDAAPVPDRFPASPDDAPTGDDPPVRTGDAAEPPPGVFKSCIKLGFATRAEFEAGFIVPRCGASMCHQAVFPPRNLNFLDKIREQLVDVRALSLCKTDYYINRADPAKSFMLAKVLSPTQDVQCPSGGARNSGGTRMPNAMPAIAGPRLDEDEINCYTWWIYEMAR